MARVRLNKEQDSRVRQLAQPKGGLDWLSAQEVVDEARPKSSILHDLFEWNDRVAAEQHRLTTGHAIIREVRYSEPVAPPQNIVTNVPYALHASGQEPGYQTTVSLRKNPIEACRALRRELAQSAALVRRTGIVATALDVEDLDLVDDLDTVLDTLMELQRRVERKLLELEAGEPSDDAPQPSGDAPQPEAR